MCCYSPFGPKLIRISAGIVFFADSNSNSNFVVAEMNFKFQFDFFVFGVQSQCDCTYACVVACVVDDLQ